MIGLSTQIQKVCCFSSILTEQVISCQAVSSSVGNDSNIATFNIYVSELMVIRYSLDERHLRQIFIHYQFLLAIMRILINLYLGVIDE